MIERFKLKDGRFIDIKILTKEDYESNNNYEFVHDWLQTVNEFLLMEFKKENLERDRKMFYEQFIENEDEIFFGALYKGQIIGSADLRLNTKIKKKEHIGEWGIVIHPDFHNQGLGKKLLTIIEEYAKKIGLKKLQASYFSKNTNAEALYVKKLNYIIEGTQKSAIQNKDGTYDDEMLIGKFLEKDF